MTAGLPRDVVSQPGQRVGIVANACDVPTKAGEKLVGLRIRTRRMLDLGHESGDAERSIRALRWATCGVRSDAGAAERYESPLDSLSRTA